MSTAWVTRAASLILFDFITLNKILWKLLFIKCIFFSAFLLLHILPKSKYLQMPFDAEASNNLSIYSFTNSSSLCRQTLSIFILSLR